MNEALEHRRMERAQRIARRVIASGGVERMSFPSIDVMQGVAEHRAPQPQPEGSDAPANEDR